MFGSSRSQETVFNKAGWAGTFAMASVGVVAGLATGARIARAQSVFSYSKPSVPEYCFEIQVLDKTKRFEKHLHPSIIALKRFIEHRILSKPQFGAVLTKYEWCILWIAPKNKENPLIRLSNDEQLKRLIGESKKQRHSLRIGFEHRDDYEGKQHILSLLF